MTQAIHLLVFYSVSREFTSTHIQQTLLLTSTTLLDTKDLLLMMLDCSIALTCLYRWFVLWERTPSNQKLDLRQDMVLLQTHSLKVQIKVLEDLRLTRTATTDVFKLRTSCNSDITYLKRDPLRVSFFMQ